MKKFQLFMGRTGIFVILTWQIAAWQACIALAGDQFSISA
jgi:hypothetical protein